MIGALLFGGIMLVLVFAGACQILGMNDWSVLLAPLMFAASSSVFQEILFRGVLFRLIERSLGERFALFHVQSNPPNRSEPIQVQCRMKTV